MANSTSVYSNEIREFLVMDKIRIKCKHRLIVEFFAQHRSSIPIIPIYRK